MFVLPLAFALESVRKGGAVEEGEVTETGSQLKLPLLQRTCYCLTYKRLTWETCSLNVKRGGGGGRRRIKGESHEDCMI